MEETSLSHDGVTINLIDSDDKLQRAVEQLSKHKELALDLEFDQNRYSYGFTLCLIQLTAGNGTCYVIDPFAIDDLQPVFNLIEDPRITKVIHHSNNDVLLLNKLGCNIKGLLDTDVAAKLLNYEKSSLATVLKEEFNIEIDKSQQSSNWNKRPLTDEQLVYAAIDVIYLLNVKNKLVNELEAKGRLHWLNEENNLLENLRFTEPDNPHLKLKNAFKLTIYQQFILKDLFDLREKLAQQFDKPAHFVIPNEALVELASNPDVDIHEWLNHTRGIHGRLKKQPYEKQLAEVILLAQNKAAQEGISHDYPVNRYKRPFKTLETEDRKDALSKVQARIIEKYGLYTSRLIINQNLITEYSFTGKLRCTKNYATTVLLDTADELGIKLPQPLINVSLTSEE
jgi:ribonuclease D